MIDAGSRVETRAAARRLGDALFRDPEVLLVARGPVEPPYVDHSAGIAGSSCVDRHEYGERPTRRFVERLRESVVPALQLPPDARVYVGGIPAQGVDFLDRSYDALPWLVLAVLSVTFLILLRAFRSIVLPLKAVVLNVLTVAAVYGLLAVVFGQRRRMGTDLPLRDALRTVDGLRGLPRVARPGVLARDRRQQARRGPRPRADGTCDHDGRRDHGGRVLGIRLRPASRPSASSASGSFSPW